MVWTASGFLDVGVGIVGVFDSILKGLGIFAHVVPEPGRKSPTAGLERRGEIVGHFRDRSKMVFHCLPLGWVRPFPTVREKAFRHGNLQSIRYIRQIRETRRNAPFRDCQTWRSVFVPIE
jgi:hypothetical protein